MEPLQQKVQWVIEEIKKDVKDLKPAEKERVLALCTNYLFGDASPSQLPLNTRYSP